MHEMYADGGIYDIVRGSDPISSVFVVYFD